MKDDQSDRTNLILYFDGLSNQNQSPLSTVDMARLLNLGTPIPLLSQTMSEAYGRLNPSRFRGETTRLSCGDLLILAHLRDEEYDLSKIGGQDTKKAVSNFPYSQTIGRVRKYLSRIIPSDERMEELPIRKRGKNLEYLQIILCDGVSVDNL